MKAKEKIFKHSQLLALPLLVISCGGSSEISDIEKIKSTYYDEYQHLSVGQAFDSWSLCSERKWTSAVSNRGEKHILFYCSIPASTVVNVIKFYSPVSKPLVGNEPYAQIQAAELQVNWLVNNNDSFSNGQAVLRVKWKDGRQNSIARDLHPYVLRDVYSNQYMFSTEYFGQRYQDLFKTAQITPE